MNNLNDEDYIYWYNYILISFNSLKIVFFTILVFGQSIELFEI
jgi:hypothetical protein